MKEFLVLWKVATASILTLAVARGLAQEPQESAGAQVEKTGAGIVVFAVVGSNRLEVISSDGTPVRSIQIPSARAIREMHAAPGEKAILLVAGGPGVQTFVEIDAQGKQVWQLPLRSVSENEMVVAYEPLAAGRVLAFFRCQMSPQKRQQGQRIALIDRSGKVVREKELDSESSFQIRAVHWIDEDRFLVVEKERVYEMDWAGKEQFVLPLAEGPFHMDCIRTPEGTYIVAASTSRETQQKTGWIAELKPDGQELWKVDHECPMSLNPSADFKTVILKAG